MRKLLLIGIILLAACAKPVNIPSRSISAPEPALTLAYDDPARGVRLYYYDTQSPLITDTPTATIVPSDTPTKTATRTATQTPTATLTRTPAPVGSLKYYVADRVVTASDFTKLAGWGINTAVVSFDVNGTSTSWITKLQAAASAGVNVVIWPSDWTHPRSSCNWENPYPLSTSGDISHVTKLLDTVTQYPNFIGIVNAQEPFWTACSMSISEMAGLKTQLKAYAASKGDSNMQVWNYIDNLTSQLPDADISRIMDVGVIWQHCAGNAEGTCAAAITATQSDVTRAKTAGVDLVFLIQTFTTSSPYTVKFSLNDLESYSCQFISTGIDGFGYYTWAADWWPDLSEWSDLQPAIPWAYQNCTKGAPVVTATPSLTATIGPSATPTLTRTPTNTPTVTQTPTVTNTPQPGQSFSFASIGDGQGISSTFQKTVNQIAGNNPNFIIFNGDLENDGVVSSEMNTMTGALKTAGLFDKTFLVRGNHDNHVSGSAGLWNTYFSTNTPARPVGMANYVYMGTTQPYLTYSFDFGNSRFIGVDVPGDVGLLTSAQYTFIDQRLTDAESSGITHAFLFWHGGEYCIESTHCSCSTRTGACTPAAFVTLANKHPVLSATFHGHEHVLSWTHMDNSRVSGLTRAYEEFFTSPSGGGSYNSYLYPARVDWYLSPMASYNEDGFALVTVSGNSFTVAFYKTGNTTPAWSKVFTK